MGEQLHRILTFVEPDSLANLVTNLNVAKCANAESAYLECTNYALEQLNLANVAMYLDAGGSCPYIYVRLAANKVPGHAGWLGWPANIGPAAQLFASVYANASSPAAVRGLATNVANYNAWSIDTCPSYTSGDDVCDEKSYINAIAPELSSAGFDAHFITDTGEWHLSRTSYLAYWFRPQRKATHWPERVGRLVQCQGHRIRCPAIH